MTSKAESVVGRYMEAFPHCGDYAQRPTIEQVEEVMRPFAPISHEVQRQIDALFRAKGLSATLVGEHCWWEADFAVSGENGPQHDHTVNFLVGDPCTCVVPHLEAAIANARRSDIDPRLISLRDKWVELGRDEGRFHEWLRTLS